MRWHAAEAIHSSQKSVTAEGSDIEIDHLPAAGQSDLIEHDSDGTALQHRLVLATDAL